MAGRVQYTRQAAGRVSYADLTDSEGSEAGESEEEQKQVKKRSKRAAKGRKGKNVQKGAENDSSGDEASDEADDNEPNDDKPRKKRAKRKTKSKGKGKAKQARAKKPAKLEIFKRLPLELLCEVFSHLAPNNLLALSKVNKQVHDLLTSKASESIWTAARRRLKMPDIEGLTEPQYAELIFGKKCQNCYGDKVGKIYHDFHIRRNLCKKCRQLKIIRIKDFAANEPVLHERLHPFALECTMKTPHPGTEAWASWQDRWGSSQKNWVFLDELWRMDTWLRDFDDQDEDSDIAAERESEEAPQPKQTRTAAKQLWKASGLAKTYLQEEARLVTQLARTAKSQVGKNPYNWDRRRAITDRFIEHYPQYEEVFDVLNDSYWYDVRYRFYAVVDRALSAMASGGPLTEQEWPGIEVKLRSVVSRATTRETTHESAQKRSKAQSSLFTRYEALKKALPESAQPFMPLFVDFLLLPSIRSLWTADGATSDQQWRDKLDEIHEEIDEFRVDLCAQARSTILDATTDRAAHAAVDECDEAEALGDDFFQLATSFVCCAFPGCPGKQRPPGRRWDYAKRRIVYDSVEELRAKDPRVDWMGPLVDVLRHQHKHHNHERALTAQQEKLTTMPKRVCLPLEVACGMLSVLELHGLDETRTKKHHLAQANKLTSGYKWINSKQAQYRFQTRPRYYRNRTAWSALLAHIKLEGEKLAKSGLYLDPPNIAFINKFDKKKVIEMTEDELDSEDQDGGGDDDSDDEEDYAEEDSAEEHSAEQNMEEDD